MAEFRERAGSLIRTAQQIAQLRGAMEEAQVLAQSAPTLIETGYDNYDETTYYTLTLEIPIPLYAQLEDQRADLEQAIKQRVSHVNRGTPGTAVTEVVISPTLATSTVTAGESTEDGASPIPGFWAAGHFRLFVSHVSSAKKGAHAVKLGLASYQIAAFVAHDDIEPTKEWQGEIESALRTMDALLAVITPDFISSRWCDQEVGIAMGRNKLVIPLSAGADPYGFLGRYQAVLIEQATTKDIARRLFEILVAHEKSCARMADALIERLATAASWDSAKTSMALLEQCPRLNRDQVARLVRSIDENNQVKSAFGVPSRVGALVARIGQPDTP